MVRNLKKCQTPLITHSNVSRDHKAWVKNISRHLTTFLIILGSIILSTSLVYSQPQQFASLSVPQKEVIVGQPFYVKIIVYTPTWFTKAPDFGEYQVRNTFTLRTQRPLGNTETIDGKRFTTLSYEYVVFPLKAGKLDLPPLSVDFESPLEGDYKGKPFHVTTKGASIEILPIPNNDHNYSLFVANNISVSESWSNKFIDLKVGDVLERTIRISTNGTLANMIPPIAFDSLTWASTYSGKPSLSQTLDGKSLSSERMDKQTYLLEKEGTYEIPEIQIHYYNLNNRKWMSKTIASREIIVADNPDLYVLKTLQDSLAMGEKSYSDTKSKTTLIFGLSIKRFLVLFAIICLTLIGLIILIKKLFAWYKEYRVHYLASETHQFKLLIRAIKTQNPSQINDHLYQWLRKLDDKHPITTVNNLVNQIKNKELAETVNEFHRLSFSSGSEGNQSLDKRILTSLDEQLRTARKKWNQLQQNQLKFNFKSNHL